MQNIVVDHVDTFSQFNEPKLTWPQQLGSSAGNSQVANHFCTKYSLQSQKKQT